MFSKNDDQSPVAPLRQPVFRMLWISWLMANVGLWMTEVAAGWMMTSLTTKPIWVALVQTAATLPVFLLALPSGALADNLDRKRYFLATQLWAASVAMLLCALVFLDKMSPPVLLALIFANGIGMAMRWPVFAAIVPEIVSKTQLPAALGLNGVSMNASRIIGPLIAGALIAGAGSAWVFLFNALLSLGAAFLISRWRREQKTNPLGRERFFAAMRVGLQHVGQSYHLTGVLMRIAVFFFHSTALMALLPLLARSMQGGSAGTFTMLLAAMGSGAITSSMFIQKLRKRYPRDGLILRGLVVVSLAMAILATTAQVWFAVPAMFIAGAAWITASNTLSVSIQMGLPDWVRARGMAIYLMTFMGASAGGAAIWGQMATWTSVPISLGLSAVSSVLCMFALVYVRPDTGVVEDITPKRIFSAPVNEAPAQGRVMVTIDFRVAPEKADDFRRLMLSESRRSRLRHGALSWELLHDLNDPGRFVEVIVDESWSDHLRRFDRVTAADVDLRERKLEFHIGAAPPSIQRYLVDSTGRYPTGTSVEARPL